VCSAVPAFYVGFFVPDVRRTGVIWRANNRLEALEKRIEDLEKAVDKLVKRQRPETYQHLYPYDRDEILQSDIYNYL